MSIVDWIEESVPGGMSSKLGRLLDVAYTIEYGADSSEQAALNLSTCSATRARGNSGSSGRRTRSTTSAEATTRFRRSSPRSSAGRVKLGHELVAIKLAGGTYTLTFKTPGTKTVAADRVVLALPFSILRSSVTSRKAGFEPLKVTRHRRAGHGLELEAPPPVLDAALALARLQRRHVRRHGLPGDLGRDASPARAAGILVDYTGGSIADGAAELRRSSCRSSSRCWTGSRPSGTGWSTLDYLAGLRVDEGLVLVLQGRPVHEVRGDGRPAPGQLPLCRRARRVPGLPGVSERGRRVRRAGSGEILGGPEINSAGDTREREDRRWTEH